MLYDRLKPQTYNEVMLLQKCITFAEQCKSSDNTEMIEYIYNELKNDHNVEVIATKEAIVVYDANEVAKKTFNYKHKELLNFKEIIFGFSRMSVYPYIPVSSDGGDSGSSSNNNNNNNNNNNG